MKLRKVLKPNKLQKEESNPISNKAVLAYFGSLILLPLAIYITFSQNPRLIDFGECLGCGWIIIIFFYALITCQGILLAIAPFKFKQKAIGILVTVSLYIIFFYLYGLSVIFPFYYLVPFGAGLLFGFIIYKIINRFFPRLYTILLSNIYVRKTIFVFILIISIIIALILIFDTIQFVNDFSSFEKNIKRCIRMVEDTECFSNVFEKYSDQTIPDLCTETVFYPSPQCQDGYAISKNDIALCRSGSCVERLTKEKKIGSFEECNILKSGTTKKDACIQSYIENNKPKTAEEHLEQLSICKNMNWPSYRDRCFAKVAQDALILDSKDNAITICKMISTWQGPENCLAKIAFLSSDKLICKEIFIDWIKEDYCLAGKDIDYPY